MKKLALTLIALSCATTLFGQGSLTPPGSPAPTMKTLQQVEPRIDLATVAGDSTYNHVITKPGSYYLSRNLVVSKLTGGVWINASGVTLDLNGFEISRGSGSDGYGIDISYSADRAVVCNGNIVGFEYGVHSDYNPTVHFAKGCLFQDMAASACSAYGIFAGESSRLINCRAIKNQGSGICASSGSTLSGCTANGNQGIYGICANSGSTLSGCTAKGNQSTYGIYADSGSTLSGCTACYNTGNDSSSYGIYASSGSTVVECTARSNSNTNSPSTSSQGIGIYASHGSLIKNCTASVNRGDGIRVFQDSSVVGNTCDSNGYSGDGAGIHSTGSDNRIDGNNVTDNDRGIDVDSGGNFITRNTASGNVTNWEVAAGNACLVVYRTSCAAISGNSGGTAPGSTDPNANFTY